MIKWAKDNWQFVTAMTVVAGWAVTNWTNYQVMQADTAHRFSDAAEHRSRLDKQTEETEQKVDRLAKEISKSRETIAEINVRQQENVKTLQKIDRKLDRMLRPRRQK